jgi:hypothetical protein
MKVQSAVGISKWCVEIPPSRHAAGKGDGPTPSQHKRFYFILPDTRGLAPAHTMMENYAGMRDIVNLMLASNMRDINVRKLAGQNYARLLKTVMQGRTG